MEVNAFADYQEGSAPVAIAAHTPDPFRQGVSNHWIEGQFLRPGTNPLLATNNIITLNVR